MSRKCDNPIANKGDKARRYITTLLLKMLVDFIITCSSFFFDASSYQTEAVDGVTVITSFLMKTSLPFIHEQMMIHLWYALVLYIWSPTCLL